MKIDGKKIAEEIKSELKTKASFFRSQNIFPHLAIIMIGEDLNSLSYVKQKEIQAKKIGIKTSIYRLQTKKNLSDLCLKLNQDDSVHGIIIQRPLPFRINNKELDRLVVSQKDIDGFRPKSKFSPPISLAVYLILENVHKFSKENFSFDRWLKRKKILVIGRGVTGGKPISEFFKKLQVRHKTADSKTENLKKMCLEADIIISCIGKYNVVRHSMIKQNTILIGVGISRNKSILQTDYDQKEMEKLGMVYTPTPGGVGPVNVACLFENLLKAVSSQLR